MHTQQDLQTWVAKRLAGIEKPAQLTAFAVMRELDVNSYVEGAIGFTLAQSPPLRREWYDSFTRTALLAGNYSRFAARYPADHATNDGALSWFGPAPAERFEGLRRLLRAFHGAAPVTVPRGRRVVTVRSEQEGHRRERRLTVALAGLSTLEYLVHLNHAVCEVAILDLVGPGDRLELVHCDEIDEPAGRWEYARVGSSADDDSRLRLYACLTKD
jgi:hypothetical protein